MKVGVFLEIILTYRHKFGDDLDPGDIPGFAHDETEECRGPSGPAPDIEDDISFSWI